MYLDELTIQLESANTIEAQKVISTKRISDCIDLYNKFAQDSQDLWSDKIWKVYEFSLKSSENPSKIRFSAHDLQYKLNNLKELAISLSSTVEEDYKIDGKDPLEYLSSISRVFEDLESLVDDWIDSLVSDYCNPEEEIQNASNFNLENEIKPINNRTAPEPTRTGGCCGCSCVLL